MGHQRKISLLETAQHFCDPPLPVARSFLLIFQILEVLLGPQHEVKDVVADLPVGVWLEQMLTPSLLLEIADGFIKRAPDQSGLKHAHEIFDVLLSLEKLHPEGLSLHDNEGILLFLLLFEEKDGRAVREVLLHEDLKEKVTEQVEDVAGMDDCPPDVRVHFILLF